MEPSNKKNSHWSIGDFYNQSWDLTWNNKKLWILGLAVSLYAAGGGGGGGNSIDTSNLQKIQEKQQEIQELPESPYSDFEVVDDAGAQESVKGPVGEVVEANETSEALEKMVEPFVAGLQNVPLHVWGLIVLEFLVLLVGVFVLALFLGAWSQAALIRGIADAAAKKKIELLSISTFAITRAKPIIWIMIVPGLKFTLWVFLIAAGGAIGIALLNSFAEGLAFLGVLAGIAGVVWFIYEAVRLSVALIYALRFCVEDNLDGKTSFNQAYILAKGNLMKTLKLGLANAIVTGIVIFAVIMPVLGVGFGTVLGDVMNNSVNVMTFVPVGVTLLLTIPIMTLIQGIIKVFTFSTWHYAFKSLTHS